MAMVHRNARLFAAPGLDCGPVVFHCEGLFNGVLQAARDASRRRIQQAEFAGHFALRHHFTIAGHAADVSRVAVGIGYRGRRTYGRDCLVVSMGNSVSALGG